MSKKNARILWLVILAVEAIVLAAMLLCDFGVLSSKIDPLSFRGVMYHIAAVIVIAVSIDNLKRIEK